MAETDSSNRPQEYKDRLLRLEEDLKETVERNGAWVEHKDLLVNPIPGPVLQII
jgi:hypothetical protein